ncbi:hypothetical protein JI742_09780 [Piscinibacter sp. Jin2]|uniref:Uncharacterized protein n=1 Tax=Aquariibacter lacus TaxID=2801332 RepID=A0A9X0XHQ3_9BURK|nr:hypothetical protein [Piscinibacter lacus]MBL0720178.1 hypothetical protein [Piscinibacter lacus]
MDAYPNAYTGCESVVDLTIGAQQSILSKPTTWSVRRVRHRGFFGTSLNPTRRLHARLHQSLKLSLIGPPLDPLRQQRPHRFDQAGLGRQAVVAQAGDGGTARVAMAYSLSRIRRFEAAH